MRSVKSAYVVVALAAVGAFVAACSADGETPDIGNAPDSAADASRTSHDSGGIINLPAEDAAPPVDTVDATVFAGDAGHDATVDAAKDSGSKDSGTADARDGSSDAHVVEASVDSGPAGTPGTPCATQDEVQKQTCGFCGFQTRVCTSDDGDAASPNLWQPWGFCQAEIPQGCAPGTTTTEACGRCGTRQKTCQLDCTYAVGACQGQPPLACAPGTTDFEVGLSCNTGGRTRTCKANCTYDTFSGCFTPDGGITGAGLTIASTAGGLVSGQFNLSPTQTNSLLSGVCPQADLADKATSYQYVQVANATGMTASVSIWSSKASSPTAKEIDTVMAAYTGTAPPGTDTERAACKVGVNDTCTDHTDPTSCLGGFLDSWAGLMIGSKPVSIPPFSSVFVYVAAYYDASSSTHASSGDYALTVRTDTIQ